MIELLLKFIGILSLGYFAQPQIKVFHKRGVFSSGGAPGNPEGIECEWKGVLVFENITDRVALKLAIESHAEEFKISSIPKNSIKPYATLEIKTVIRKSFPRETVIACQDRFLELLPNEIKNLNLVISYQNIKGKLFYTKYNKDMKDEHCSYCFRKPKLETPTKPQTDTSQFTKRGRF